MNNMSIGFILDLIEENNSEYSAGYEPVEANTLIIDKFF